MARAHPRREEALARLRDGEDPQDVARLLGVKMTTLRSWMSRYLREREEPEPERENPRAREPLVEVLRADDLPGLDLELRGVRHPPGVAPDVQVAYDIADMIKQYDPLLQRWLVYYTGEFLADPYGAAREAGMTGEPWPDWRLRRQLAAWKRDPAIKETIAQIVSLQTLSRGEILSMMALDATASMADFLSIEDDGRVRIDLRKAQGRGRLRHIKKIKVRETSRYLGSQITEVTQHVEMELYDAAQARRTLADILNLFEKDDPGTPEGVRAGSEWTPSVEDYQRIRQEARKRGQEFRAQLGARPRLKGDDDEVA